MVQHIENRERDVVFKYSLPKLGKRAHCTICPGVRTYSRQSLLAKHLFSFHSEQEIVEKGWRVVHMIRKSSDLMKFGNLVEEELQRNPDFAHKMDEIKER